MFTGIISHLAKIEKISDINNKEKEIIISVDIPEDKLEIGQSIACDGICLTITEFSRDLGNDEIPGQARDDEACERDDEIGERDRNINRLTKSRMIVHFFVSHETLDKTTASDWQDGRFINIEMAMGMNSLFNGHMVTGHVDTISTVKKITKLSDSTVIEFELENTYLEYLISKGSVTINGVSLTVNEVHADSFEVNIIPHTYEVTNIKELRFDSKVNVEVDMIAKYIKKYTNLSNK